MTLAEMRRQQERRYWQDLLVRLPSVKAAARVADLPERCTWKHLRACGVDPRNIRPPRPALLAYEVGLTLKQFLQRSEHVYWLRIFATSRCTARASRIAGVNRVTVYRRLQACKLSLRFIRNMLGKKLDFGGNQAWRDLADDRPASSLI